MQPLASKILSVKNGILKGRCDKNLSPFQLISLGFEISSFGGCFYQLSHLHLMCD
jgi:hypothetical protein